MGIFDRIFVNDFGLPFNSGVLFFFLLIIGLIIFGLFKTRKQEFNVEYCDFRNFGFINWIFFLFNSNFKK